MDDAGRLLVQLCRVTLVGGIDGTLRWMVTRDGVFLVMSLYKILHSKCSGPFPKHLMYCVHNLKCVSSLGKRFWGRFLF